MTTKAQLAQYCADHPVTHTVTQYIHSGVTMSHAIIAGVVSLLIGFGIGWYVKGRGLTGVKIDATNVVTDAQAVETKVAAAV